MIDFSAAIQEPEPIQNQPVAIDPYDITPIKTKFKLFEQAIHEMQHEAKELQVTDDASNKQAVSMAGQTKNLAKKIEALRKQIVEAPNKFVKAVNTFAKNYKDPLSDIEANLKGKISHYQIEQERKRREAERKAREEAEKLRRKLEEEARAEQRRLEEEARKKAEAEARERAKAEKLKKEEADRLAMEAAEKAAAEVEKMEPVLVPEPVLPDKPKITRTESGSASLRKTWAWKEVDISKVPDEYKVLDRVKINKAVKAGIRTIPGIEIYEEAKTVIR